MNSNYTTMKRNLLLLCVLLMLGSSLMAQEKKFEITTRPVSAAGTADGKITITVLESKAFYIYGLWDKAPWDEGTELSNSGSVKESSYTFSDLKSGDYIVYIQFGDDSGNYETVHVR
jgi:hypothetical protein